jgi:hypothetical protein
VNDDHEPPVDGEPAFDDPAFDEPAFDDPAFDEVRALLADARVTEPVPTDVAARLDATLAALQEERRAETVVVPLRRRRTAARVLVAAAAVVVVTAGGVGIAQVAQRGSSGSDATTADAVRGEAGADAATTAPSAPGALAPSAPPPAKSQLDAQKLAELPVFTSTRFAEQAAAFDLDTRGFAADSSQGDSSAAPSPTAADAPVTAEGRTAAACAGPLLPDTTSVPILFDREPAVLVVHRSTDGTQEVEAYSCDGATVLAHTTVAR